MDIRSASTRALIRRLSTVRFISIARRILLDARTSRKNAPRWSKPNQIDRARKASRRRHRDAVPAGTRTTKLKWRDHEDDNSINTLCRHGLGPADRKSNRATGSDAGTKY